MLINNNHLAELQASEQTIRARVELYSGSTLEEICDCGEILEEFAVEKTGEGKYFGFGICQKLKATLIDIHNAINLSVIDSAEASFGVGAEFVYPFPKFYLKEVERDEVFNIIKIVAYDKLFTAANHTVSELLVSFPYTLKDYASAIAAALELPLVIDEAAADAFKLYYGTPANLDGTETLRAALDAIAEATQTIYFIDKDWNLRFKRLDKNGAAALAIGKNSYIELTDDGARTIGSVAHITELGDNIEADSSSGDVQYIRNNPFWELREDIGALVDNARSVVDGLSINQFRCDWSGNYLLEIGDKITLTKDDDTVISTFVLDDNITFNGALWQINGWTYDGSEAESSTNPTSLGEALNQTFAKVDKVNKQITLLAQEIDGVEKKRAELEIRVDGISTEVESQITQTDLDNLNTILTERISSVEQSASGISATVTSAQKRIDTLEGDYGTLEDKVIANETAIASFDLTPYDAALEFKKTVEENGVTKLDTTTGFTFDENGLRIEKSDSEIHTTITEDGMTVTKSGDDVLTANNAGVKAVNLHATTYLIIGETSRFENWTDENGNLRTACFWIGS